MTTLENIQTLNGQLAETKAGIPLAKDINEIRVLTNTMVSIENGVKKLEEIKAEKEKADIRQRVEHLTFFASCKEQLKAFLLEASDENKKVLVEKTKGLIVANYFSGYDFVPIYSENKIKIGEEKRFVSISIEKGGKITAYYQTNAGPIIGKDSLGLMKFKELNQYLGLVIKHNGLNSGTVAELFKLAFCEQTTKYEIDGIRSLFMAIQPNLQAVKDSFHNIPVTTGYVTMIKIGQDGKKSYSQKAVLGMETINAANGKVASFKHHNRLQEKSLSKAKADFLADAKKRFNSI